MPYVRDGSISGTLEGSRRERNVRFARRVQLVTATPLVVYRQEFRIPRSFGLLSTADEAPAGRESSCPQLAEVNEIHRRVAVIATLGSNPASPLRALSPSVTWEASRPRSLAALSIAHVLRGQFV